MEGTEQFEFVGKSWTVNRIDTMLDTLLAENYLFDGYRLALWLR
jgi:hypothetical protein